MMLDASDSYTDNDMEVKISEKDSKLETPRRTSRIRHSSRKMLEAQAILKKQMKATISESTVVKGLIENPDVVKKRDFDIDSTQLDKIKRIHQERDQSENTISFEERKYDSNCQNQKHTGISPIMLRRKSFDLDLINNNLDFSKQLGVGLKANTIAGTNSMENLFISEKKGESLGSESKVKRGRSLDLSSSNMNDVIFDLHNKIESDKTSNLCHSKRKKEWGKEDQMEFVKLLNKKAKNSLNTKCKADKVQNIRKKLKPNTRTKFESNDSIGLCKDGNQEQNALTRMKERLDYENYKEYKEFCSSSKTEVDRLDDNLSMNKGPSVISINLNKVDNSIQSCQSLSRNIVQSYDCNKKCDTNMLRLLRLSGEECDFDEDKSLNQLPIFLNKEISSKIKSETKLPRKKSNASCVKLEKKIVKRAIKNAKNTKLKVICNIDEDKLLNQLPIVLNKKINCKVKAGMKLPRTKSNASVIKLEKKIVKNAIKNANKSELKVCKKVANNSVKNDKNSKKSPEFKKKSVPASWKKKDMKLNTVIKENQLKDTLWSSNQKRLEHLDMKYEIKEEENCEIKAEDVDQEDSCRSLLITEFTSLLSKYGAITLSSTKKKLWNVPTSFLNLELVTAAINCQYFGYKEVFDWIGKCLKLKNVSLTHKIEKQFKLFEQFFVHMSKGLMNEEEEIEWSKLKVRYYNLPVDSQTSWELVFGYTPKFCYLINVDSSSRKTIMDSLKEDNNDHVQSAIGSSLMKCELGLAKQKGRPNRNTKREKAVVSPELRKKIPMVKIYGITPDMNTKKSILDSSSSNIKLKKNLSTKKDTVSCEKNIGKIGKFASKKFFKKGQRRKNPSKKIQLKETLWSSKQKKLEKLNMKCEIKTEPDCEMKTDDNIQKEKTKLKDTSENSEIEIKINNETNIKPEPHKDAICKGVIAKENSISYGEKIMDIQLSHKKSVKQAKFKDKEDNPPEKQELSLAKEIFKLDSSHSTNVTDINLPTKDQQKNNKLDKEVSEKIMKKNKGCNVNDDSMDKINKKIINKRFDGKKDVHLSSPIQGTEEVTPSQSHCQIIPTIVNCFERKNMINVGNSLETLECIQKIMDSRFCNINTSNLNREFLQKSEKCDNTIDCLEVHTLDLETKSKHVSLESHERHFTRSVSIIKADKIETSEKIVSRKKSRSLSFIDLDKNANIFDPEVSVIFRGHESPHKKKIETCSCCKSLAAIKSHLKNQQFKMEYKKRFNIDQNNNDLVKSVTGDLETCLETPKASSFDNLIKQIAFLERDLQFLKDINEKDINRLKERHICELNEEKKNHKEYSKKFEDDTIKFQEQIKDLMDTHEKDIKRIKESHVYELKQDKEDLKEYGKKNEDANTLKAQIKDLNDTHDKDIKMLTENHIYEFKEYSKKLKDDINTLKKQINDLNDIHGKDIKRLEENHFNEFKDYSKKNKDDTNTLKTQIKDLHDTHEKYIKQLEEKHISQIEKEKETHRDYSKKLEDDKITLEAQIQLLENQHEFFLIDKKYDMEKQEQKFIQELEKQRERHNAQLKKLEVHKQNLKSQLQEKDKFIVQNYKDYDHGIISPANNSLKRENCDENQRTPKLLKSDITFQSVDTSKVEILKEKQKESTSYHPESSCSIVAKILKHNDKVVDIKSPINSLNDGEHKSSSENLSPLFHSPVTCKPSIISSYFTKSFKCTAEGMEVSSSNDKHSISSEKKKINVEEYRLRNCKNITSTDESNTNCTAYITFDNIELESEDSEIEILEENIQGKDHFEEACRMCLVYKKELEKLSSDLQEVKKSSSEKDHDLNATRADIYNRYHMMKTSFKSDFDDLTESNEHFKKASENLMKNNVELKCEQKEKEKIFEEFKKISEKKHIESEKVMENLRKQFEQSQYGNILLKKEIEKINLDLGNSKLKNSLNENRHKKEIVVKENEINQLGIENAKKEVQMLKYSLQENSLKKEIKVKENEIDRIWKENNKKDELLTENENNIQRLKQIEKNMEINEIVSKRSKQIEKNTAILSKKVKETSQKLTQKEEENKKMETTIKELNSLLFKESSKLKLLKTQHKNLQKQQLELAKENKSPLELDKKKENEMLLKIEEKEQEIIELKKLLSDAKDVIEKEREATEYYGRHLYYQREQNGLLEERLCAVYRENLTELSLQLCNFTGAAERYKEILKNISDLTEMQQHNNDLFGKGECLDLCGMNPHADITVIEKQDNDLDSDQVQELEELTNSNLETNGKDSITEEDGRKSIENQLNEKKITESQNRPCVEESTEPKSDFVIEYDHKSLKNQFDLQ